MRDLIRFLPHAFAGVVACSVVFVSGCASTPPAARAPISQSEGYDDSESVKTTRKEFRRGDVSPGYELELSNVEDPKLNGKFRVDFDGVVKLPYNVSVKTTGLSLGEIQSRIAKSYKKYFRSRPKFTVTLSDRKLWIETRGLLEKPGRYLVPPATTIDELISLSGGFQKPANARYLKIDQSSGTTTLKLSDYYSGIGKDQVPAWIGGDRLFFLADLTNADVGANPDHAYLQLLGEVRNPGEYRFRKDADFYSYLSKAGGPTQNADLEKIELIRGGPGNRTSSIFGTADPKSLPPLGSGDTVLIHSDKPTPVERSVPLIATIVNTILLSIILIVK